MEIVFLSPARLALFILGPTLPVTMSLLGYPMYASDGSIQLVAFVSLSSEFIAIALGFVGRHHLSGKVALFGASIILVFVCLLPRFSHFRRVHQEQVPTKPQAEQPVHLRIRFQHGAPLGSGEAADSTGLGGGVEEPR